MSKNGSIRYQVSNVLKPMIKYGESKHAVKVSQIKDSRIENQRINPICVDGIYAHKTFQNVTIQLESFAAYMKDVKGSPLKAATVKEVDAYIEKLRSQNKSPATIKMAEYSIWKALGIHTSIALQPLKRNQIKRSRVPRKHDYLVDEQKLKDVVVAVKALNQYGFRTFLKKVEDSMFI